MRHRNLTILLAIALLVSLSLACGKLGATPTPEPTNTPQPTNTPLPTNTPAPTATKPPAPTNTPAPTATKPPAPTNTPEAEPTPTSDGGTNIDVPADAEEGLIILAHNGFTDDDNTAYVVGQVYNNSDTNYEYIEVNCAFYDKSDKLLTTESTYAYIDILLPEERAPFKISLWDAPTDLDHYVVSVAGDETTNEPFIGIEFVQDVGDIDGENVTIMGEVTNTSDTPASQVRIAATIYDESDNILDTSIAYAERDVFFQESISPFKVWSTIIQGEADHYSLIVYADTADDWELDEVAEVTLNSISYYEDSFEDLVIVGEVTNDEDVNIEFVKAFASFYNEAEELVAVEWTYAWADILTPGSKTPFSISMFETPEDVDHWTVWAIADKSDEEVAGQLVLEGTDNNIGADGAVTFTGTVRNAGTDTMTSIQLAVTIYDAEDNVVMVDQEWLEGDLEPNATMTFEFTTEAAEGADHFELYVQGSVKTD